MRWFVLLAVLALGCDDPTVATKITSALAHGIVAADALCECDMTNDSATHTNHFGPYRLQKLFDGSCFIRADGSVSLFRARYEECINSSAPPYSIAGGEFRYLGDESPANRYRASITTCCTGFNFEAFGVE